MKNPGKHTEQLMKRNKGHYEVALFT